MNYINYKHGQYEQRSSKGVELPWPLTLSLLAICLYVNITELRHAGVFC